MEKFNFNRFLKVLYWFLRTNGKQLLMWFTGAATFVLLVQFFALWVAKTQGITDAHYVMVLMGTRTFMTIVGCIAILIILATVFRPLNKKQQATAFLMLPAANMEKYWVMFLYVTVIWPLCIFLGYVVADTLRMVIVPLFNDLPYLSTLKNIQIFNFGEGGMGKVTMVIYTITIIVWLHSCYIAAGSVFRKYAFAIASAGLLLLVTLFEYGCQKIFGHNTLITMQNGVLIVNNLIWVLIAVLLVWAVYNYRLSYRMFKNYQVINNKRTNL